MDSFSENCAWTLEGLPADQTAVKCKWVFKKKLNSDDSVLLFGIDWLQKDLAKNQV